MTSNAIVLENQKAGAPMSAWWVDPGQDSTTIQGFTTGISTNLGGTVQFKVNNQTGNPNYTINIYRLGYYGGAGATFVTSLQHTTSVVQPAPLRNATTGEVDAGNWSVTDSWKVPTSATSGVYIANIVDGAQVFQIPFIVRNDASTSDIVFQTADQTWQAYNPWGGANLYQGNGPGDSGAAYAVSYNRPITTRDGGLLGTSNDMVFSAEFPTIYWMERNGYDVSYISGLDAATNGSLLLNHKVYMDSGHDEYWTDSQYKNVQAAGHAGVSLMFLSGNEIYWQTRLAPSLDASATPNRTLVDYKDTHANALIDPSGTATSTFMDARFASSGGLAGVPSNSLTGQVFSVDSDRYDTITIPYGQTQLRIWRNTAVASTAPGGTASLAPGLLGYEWDTSPNDAFRPAGLVDLSSTTLQVQTLLLDYGNTTGPGTATHNLVQFRDPVSGAMVFSTGTVFWSWGLSDIHDINYGALQPVDPSVQQATVNVLAEMGVQPQTLQASLALAAASTDHTAPTSRITSLSATSVVEGQAITVKGTASDSGGVIGGVEVSSDGGKTWRAATSTVGAATATWSYTFTTKGPGSYTVLSRAVDDSINLEKPTGGSAYTVTPSSNLSIWSSTATPVAANVADAGGKSGVELGVQFVSSTSGLVTGIRFYKGAQNTGTHIGDLWSSTGSLLASATFTNETSSGWQQVNFASPVQIQAGATYTASYWGNSGYYASDDFYFVSPGVTHGSLTATGGGMNGVFAYGATSTFPGSVYLASSPNYWVDLVFNDTSGGSGAPQANNDSGFTTTAKTALTIPVATLLANDTDPNGLPLIFQGVSNPVGGAAVYNSAAQTVTFTPTTGYVGAASFTYSITDAKGGTGSAGVSLTVTNPAGTESLFSANATPATVTVNDTSPVELGVRFTAAANGLISGIRFYKGPSNTGTHFADLWSSTGALLATATFTNETASGWQQVNFSTPVAITAGTTYTAAYHSSGYYSANENYFAANLVSGDLTAPASNNGVYAYSSTRAFPTSTYQASNYWVDVVYSKSSGAQPPVATNDSGFTTLVNTALPIAASALLANDTDPNGLPLSIASVSAPVNGTVAYNSSTQTVTFTPTANFTGAAGFTYTIKDSAGGTASANVSLNVNPATATQSLFSSSATPAIITENDSSAVELGVRFMAAANGLISGIRFYKGPSNIGAHVADLWSSSGALLASATFTNETASGWQQVNFASPIAITAGTTYTASYHTSGYYSANSNYFTSNVVSGDLTAPAANNGVYAYGASSAFPTNTYQASNYWVDVVYSKSSGTQAPVAKNDSGFVATLNTPLTINASQLLANDTDPNGLPLSVTGVSNAANGAVSYNAQAKTVTFTPNANYTGPASFSYSIADTAGGTASANVSLSVTSPSVVSLFPSTWTPAIVTENDSLAVELGFKFTASQAGQVTGVEFYKGPLNTGTHVAHLWSATGALLASATFTNETASGWQQVNFATPVTVTPGTTYIASYHTNTGEYSVDPNLFASSISNGPLTAPSSASSGGNGVYAYGSTSLFPANTYNASGYGVDVLFKPQLA
ncbi:hypothetical protein M2323_001243 [Rhodoblastus acidophilus]|uniref:DUF4082 domain-containing protein n=1 Tax=Rhodoblastus acidophilus TaxID=1074 RepID=UPI00222448A8|nr:DUF4082 domain-containing protein [Rhodoblastus acidophilus]MCW2283343.1 hypothetical protein [Rhodoblastus acidophilus]MCW2332333.1 hypothetical protein [Rhodoblastus acidophilus]